VLKVLSDILLAIDSGDLSALVLLDLSAAFDMVDHDILIRRLKTPYGLSGMVLQWFQTYLVGRSQCVRTGLSASLLTLIVCGVPQGSVLGPILFLLYTADRILLIRGHGLCHICTQTTHRSTGSADRLRHWSSRAPSRTVLMMLPGGCVPIGSS